MRKITTFLFLLLLILAAFSAVYSQNLNQKISITATNVWSKGGVLERPQVWFKLFRQEGEAGQIVEVPAAEADVKEVPAPPTTANAIATVTWDNLDSHSPANVEYVYSVRETDQNGNPFTPNHFLTVEHGLTVLNKYAPGPKYEVFGRKFWHNLTDSDPRPTYTMVLKQNEIVMEGKQKEMIPPAYIHMWTLLDLYQTDNIPYNYTVEEEPVPNGYVHTIKMGNQTIRTANGNFTFPDPHTWEIHNEYTGGPARSVTGTKIWEGGTKPNVWFKLQRKTATIAVHDVPGAELKPISDTTLTAIWENLPTYATNSETFIYTIIETDENGNEFIPPHYDQSYSEDQLTVTNTAIKQGDIQIELVLYPANSETASVSFQPTGTGWEAFELTATNPTNLQTLREGEYAINQVQNPELPLLDSFCFSSIAGKPQNPDKINLEVGETVRCKFIYVPPNSIAVKKLTAGITDETFEFEGALAGKIKNGGYLVKTDADPDGSLWEVKEAAKNGWKLDSITCKETNAANSELLTEVQIDRNRVMFGLDQGEVILCTFINKQFIELPSTGFPVESSVSPQQ